MLLFIYDSHIHDSHKYDSHIYDSHIIYVQVLFFPSNQGNGNLQRIEEVERIIYAGAPRSMVRPRRARI